MITVTLFCNSQKFETSQMSTNWSMNKQNPLYPHNKILVSNKKELIHAISWINIKCIIAKWKKPDTKDYRLHDSTYIKFYKQ